MNRTPFVSVLIAGLLIAAVSLSGLISTAAAGDSPPGRPSARAPGLGTPLPSSVNLAHELPPVGDQTDIFPGSQICHTFASCYYSFNQYIKHFVHPEWDLSDPRYRFGPSFPAWPGRGGDYDCLQTHGNVDEAEIPYDPAFSGPGPTAAQDEAAKQYRISGWAALWDYGQDPPLPLSTTDEAITNAKAWLNAGHILDIGIMAFPDFPRQHGDHSQDTHYYDPNPTGPHTIGHEVNLVGYDDNINPGGADADHRGGFLMVNCWGTEWNGDMKGFVWVSYAYVKHYVTNCYVITGMLPVNPSIAGCSTASGKAGDTVVISGNNFGTERRASRVTFNGIEAETLGRVNDSIVTEVPWNATTGPLVVYDWNGTPSNSFGFTVDHPAPAVASITPGSGAAGTALVMPDLTGKNFFGTPVVKLKRSGRPDIVASSVQVTSSTKAVCSFNLSRADPGLWDVYLENPDGQSATMPEAFTVTTPTWYLAEGSTAWGFDTSITIANPQTESLKAKVTYMDASPGAGCGKKAEQTVTLPALSQTTITNDAIITAMGGPSDFSTEVECTGGRSIAVDRTMTWTGEGAAGPEAHTSIGTTSPSTTWYLPEGSSAWGFETWTLVENPNDSEADVTLTYMTPDEMQKVVRKKVPACSRASFSMAEEIGEKDASVEVTSSLPVVAESSQYRNSRRGGSCSVGTTTPSTDYFLAEGTTGWGFTTFVLIQNPHDSQTDVTVTYMTPRGTVEESFTMGPNSRKTINVNVTHPDLPHPDFSTKVHGSQTVIAARAMYWNNGTGEACHGSIGMNAPHASFYLPDGETTNGRETWTLVQNPNSENVTVEISYLTPTGAGNVTKTETIGANSRQSFNMIEHSGISGRAAIKVVSKNSGKKIMVERAMYWNSRGAGTATIGGYGD